MTAVRGVSESSADPPLSEAVYSRAMIRWIVGGSLLGVVIVEQEGDERQGDDQDEGDRVDEGHDFVLVWRPFPVKRNDQ